MAGYTVFFPDGKYPDEYELPIADFEGFNPHFGDIVNLSEASLSAHDGTEIVYELSNGLILKISGTGFVYDEESEDWTAGKVSKLDLFLNDGTTRVSTTTLSKLSLATLMESAAMMDQWSFGEWIFNRADTLTGSEGHDDLFGYGGNDVIIGKGGDDYMDGGAGKDRFDGGTGWDQISYQHARSDPNAYGGIDVDATKLKLTDPYGFVETFKSIESFRGTNWSDTFSGSNRGEEFMGLGGRDFIDGKGGVDAVRYHRDERQGGLEQGVEVDLAEGFAIDGYGKRDRLLNIENVRGTAYDDELRGSNVANYLRADDGDDTLAGGLGNDELDGGNGADIFLFDTALNANTNVDVIYGFDSSEDMIHLSLSIFAALSEGTLQAEQFIANDTGLAETADQRIIYNSETGELFYDADGSDSNSDRVLFAGLDVGLSVTEEHFLAI